MTGAPRVHASALIEAHVEIGAGTAIWSGVHVRGPARIGRDCIVGEDTYIAYGVEIGDRVKLNASVYVCTGVTLRTGVMVGAHTVFTNDRYPRATTSDLRSLRPSEPDENTRPTLVEEGASIGAACVVGCDLTIGRFAMVGMGAVVTRPVPAFHLALGHPARVVAVVCRCGAPLVRFSGARAADDPEVVCDACGSTYALAGGAVHELAPPS